MEVYVCSECTNVLFLRVLLFFVTMIYIHPPNTWAQRRLREVGVHIFCASQVQGKGRTRKQRKEKTMYIYPQTGLSAEHINDLLSLSLIVNV